MAGPFVSVRYKKKLSEAKNHINYIAFRSRELDDNYGLFNELSDNVDVKAFTDSLDVKKTSHSSVAKVHTLLFSMSGNEWERSQFEQEDYKEMIRNIMADYELDKGIKLNWVAAEHPESTHPHVHVAIKATYLDRDGVEKRLYIPKEDKAWFKEQFTHHKNRIRGFELEPPSRHFDRNKHRQIQGGKDLFNNVMSQIKRRMKEREYEIEREKDRDR